MTPQTPQTEAESTGPTTAKRDAAAIAGELRELHEIAARSFAPANLKRASELMADFADATVRELAELRERSEAAEQELAAIREAE